MATAALTSLSHGAGCGCKLPAQELFAVLSGLDGHEDRNVLIDATTADDAAVYRLSDELALVQSVDFFTPIVDDPYDFGRIAAANALSDVYAMGGTPITAMNLVAFPLEQLGAAVLRLILEGGLATARAAGCSLVGGHSIDDPEPKYGMAVTGTVDPRRILSNAGARAGDALVLTKPLGVGAICTGHRRGAASDAQLGAATESMSQLNADASHAALALDARAATDVTGFGLLGHLHSLALQSGVAAEVEASSVPCLDGAEAALGDGRGVSGGTRRNLRYAEAFTDFAPTVPQARRLLVCDATTSGGLLVALAPQRADELPGAVVGRLVDGPPGEVVVI